MTLTLTAPTLSLIVLALFLAAALTNGRCGCQTLAGCLVGLICIAVGVGLGFGSGLAGG